VVRVMKRKRPEATANSVSAVRVSGCLCLGASELEEDAFARVRHSCRALMLAERRALSPTSLSRQARAVLPQEPPVTHLHLSPHSQTPPHAVAQPGSSLSARSGATRTACEGQASHSQFSGSQLHGPPCCMLKHWTGREALPTVTACLGPCAAASCARRGGERTERGKWLVD
jgi:hypothetical protein